MDHAEKAEAFLDRLSATASAAVRPDTRLNQSIGVHLKLADVHARLAVAVSHSGTAL